MAEAWQVNCTKAFGGGQGLWSPHIPSMNTHPPCPRSSSATPGELSQLSSYGELERWLVFAIIVRNGMISDQQLIEELARRGQTVTTALLKSWRASGLLPPLNTRGLGRAGKAFFWTDPEIISRAQYVYDALLEFRDPKRVLWLLWITGFDVSIGQVKRVWLSRLRHGPTWSARQTEPELLRLGVQNLSTIRANPIHEPTPSTIILNLILAVSEPLVARNDWIDWKLFVLTAKDFLHRLNLGRSSKLDEWTTTRITALIATIGGVAELSNLIGTATANELIEVRRIVAAVSRLFEANSRPEKRAALSASNPPFWQPQLAVSVATPLMLVTLLLVRAGRKSQVERTGRAIAALAKNGDNLTLQARVRFAKRMQATWRDFCVFH